ncbi:hypothetical protein D3C78_1388690 [compost metagenome]
MLYFNHGSLKYNFSEINELGDDVTIRSYFKQILFIQPRQQRELCFSESFAHKRGSRVQHSFEGTSKGLIVTKVIV